MTPCLACALHALHALHAPQPLGREVKEVTVAALHVQDMTTFNFLLTSLDVGLKSLDMAISSSCAAALDAIAAFYFRNCVQV